jgi:hypothetical protein
LRVEVLGHQLAFGDLTQHAGVMHELCWTANAIHPFRLQPLELSDRGKTAW